MKTQIPAAYQAALKSGKTEFATTSRHGTSSVVRSLNVIEVLEENGISLPEGGVSGTEINRIFLELKKRGVNIPDTSLNKTEARSLGTGRLDGLSYQPLKKKTQKSFFDSWPEADKDLIRKHWAIKYGIKK